MEWEAVRTGVVVLLAIVFGGFVTLGVVAMAIWTFCGYDCVTGSREGKRELAKLHAKGRSQLEHTYTVDFDETYYQE